MRAVLVPHSDVPAFDAVPDAVISGLAQLMQHIDAWAAGGNGSPGRPREIDGG
jgi:hypothetical protein